MKLVLLILVCLITLSIVVGGRDTAVAAPTAEAATCTAGNADNYPCKNVNLLAQIPLNKLGGQVGNDIWGWTDPQSNKEYALMGLNNGIAFIDVSDPSNPLRLGNLPTHSTNSVWRDVKVYNNYAYIVSEASGHGLQIFDLTQLRNVANPPQTFSETTHYSGFSTAHNIVINEDSAYAYAVGSNSCNGGLHMLNIQDPINPAFAGCFSSDGYTHDAQCVNYLGPDVDYTASEICFNANEDTLTLADVTDKNNPVMNARKGYGGARYSHQGWLTADHTYFLLGDEGDEVSNGFNTRTYIWDVSDLDNPLLIGWHTADIPAIDHNLYIHNGLVYQANYSAGLRILTLDKVTEGNLTEIAYFDTYPLNNSASYNGAWSIYPFFNSGTIIVSDIDRGLFVLEMDLTPSPTYEINIPMITNS